MRTTTYRMFAAAGLTVALLAGCSGGGGSTGVATLTESSDGTTTDADAGTELTEAQALEFAQCMRDNGVEDFADPTIDADGNVRLFGGGGPGTGSGAAIEDMQPAMEACSELLEGITLGGGRGGPGGGFDNTEMQDALVEYSDCLRDEGLDVGDLTLGPPGGAGNGAADGATDGGATGDDTTDDDMPPTPPADGERGPGGDPSARLIESLGLDPDDPEVAAAIETCQPVLEAAFSNFGAGAEGDDE